MIPKTIEEIYIAALVGKHRIKLSRNGAKIYIHLSDQTIWNRIRGPHVGSINTHILRPTHTKMKGANPKEHAAEYQEKMYRMLGDIPKCGWLDCGRNIDYGYKYCNQHRILCCKCGSVEADAHLNGQPYCWDCWSY